VALLRRGDQGVTLEAVTEAWRPAIQGFLSESGETDDAQGNAIISGVVGQNPEIFADLVVGRVARWGLTLELLGADVLIPLVLSSDAGANRETDVIGARRQGAPSTRKPEARRAPMSHVKGR